MAFLVFEGLDGSGKSTLMAGLAEELGSRAQSFVVTREPGGTALAEEIRRLLLRTDGEVPAPPTELLLYSASRAQHVAGVIAPALNKGDWVLCDRFSASTVSFQCFARKLERAAVDWLNRFAQQGVEPDLYILLDLTVEESRRRQGRRTAGSGQESDRMERESVVFHEAVRAGYLAQAKESPTRWLVLDATEAPEKLRQQLIQALRQRKLWPES